MNERLWLPLFFLRCQQSALVGPSAALRAHLLAMAETKTSPFRKLPPLTATGITYRLYESPTTGLRGMLMETAEPLCSLHVAIATESDTHDWTHKDDGLPHTLEHAIFLTHWGFACNDERLAPKADVHCVRGQLGFRAHRLGQDIVLPPLHNPKELLPAALWLRALSDPAPAAASVTPSPSISSR